MIPENPLDYYTRVFFIINIIILILMYQLIKKIIIN